MGSIGLPEITLLVVLALFIFGPERLPGIARTVGKTIAQFKGEAQSTIDELKRSADFSDLKDVADEFKSTRDELRRSSQLSGPVASPARPRTSGETTVSAQVTPPFDPDAT